MTWLEEARRSIVASWLLFIRDPSAYNRFNNTEAGFWRSFSAIVLVAPLYLYATGIEARLPEADSQANPGLVWSALGLVLQWVGWPLIMVWVARLAGLSRHYARYIIAYNWSTVLVILVFLPPLILYDLGFLATGSTAVLSLIVLLASLYYRWYIALRALETTGVVAFALMLADVVLSVLISQFVG